MLQVDVTSGGLDRHWAIINCMTRKTPDWIRPKSLLTNKVRQIHHEFPQRAGYDENILRSSKWSPWNAPKMTVKRRRCKGYQRNRSFLAEKKKRGTVPHEPSARRRIGAWWLQEKKVSWIGGNIQSTSSGLRMQQLKSSGAFGWISKCI